MARPIRIEYPKAYYHITSRGNARLTIFLDQKDHESFLELLGEGSRKFRVRVYAFVLMSNHYHLLVQTEEANLSLFMRYLNGTYTQQFNRRHRRVGHVMQGRYKAILVEDESYFDELIRYIHLNPYRVGMTNDIDTYRHSSHQAVLDSKESRAWSAWFDAERILRHFGDREKEAVQRYKEFLEDGKRRKPKNMLTEAHFGYILGSEALVKWVQECFIDKKEDREYTGLKEIKRAQVGVEDILAAVGRELAVPREEIVGVKKGRGGTNLARQMALYLISKNCSITQREIGKIFGGVSNVSISATIRRFQQGYSSDKTVSQTMTRINNTLIVKT